MSRTWNVSVSVLTIALILFPVSSVIAQVAGPNLPPTRSGSVGPDSQGTGGHDLPPRGAPTQTVSPNDANLTPEQCRNFLKNWAELSVKRKNSLQETKARCDTLTNR